MTKHWMKLIFRLVKGEAKISDLEDITTETTKNESEKKKPSGKGTNIFFHDFFIIQFEGLIIHFGYKFYVK